jgi:hypothetical protein
MAHDPTSPELHGQPAHPRARVNVPSTEEPGREPEPATLPLRLLSPGDSVAKPTTAPPGAGSPVRRTRHDTT